MVESASSRTGVAHALVVIFAGFGSRHAPFYHLACVHGDALGPEALFVLF